MTMTDAAGNPLASNDPRVIVVQQPPPPPPQQQPEYLTKEQAMELVEAARKEEKDKLYENLNTMDSRLKTFEEERQRLADEAAAAEAAKEEVIRQQQQEELTIAERYQQLEQTWEQKFAEQQQAMSAQQAVFEKEKEFAQIANYRQQRINELGDQIDPRFFDFVGGNSPRRSKLLSILRHRKLQKLVRNFRNS